MKAGGRCSLNNKDEAAFPWTQRLIGKISTRPERLKRSVGTGPTWKHRWRYYVPPGHVYYYAPPVYYAPRPVVVYPAPSYYEPAPVYYPPPGLTINIPLR